MWIEPDARIGLRSAGGAPRRGVAWRAGLSAAAVLVLCVASSVQAQQPTDAFLNQQRALEEEVREALNRELPADQKLDLDWGGWYSFHLFLFDDGIDSSRTFRRHDLRVWSSASIDQGAHQFYIRGKLLYEDFNTGDSYNGDDNDWVGPNLDRGFYQFDLRRAAKAYTGRPTDWNFNLKIGRDLVTFGTGYALSLPMDHVLARLELAKFEITGLAGTSIRSTDDIDRTRPNSGDSERNFWGAQIKYTGMEKHEPFVYAFWNEDQHRGGWFDPFTEYDYDSWYIGTGSTGEVVPDLRYGTEWVFEGGHSYGDAWPPRRHNIEAWAFDATLEYMPHWRLKPRFLGEYMFASGDPDRRGSPTDTRGGNNRGQDSSFVGFGYRDTGLSFGPRLSNVHIWRAGAACRPFDTVEALDKFEVGTDWFLYAKNRSSGAVSDFTADERSGYLGWEMDYFINWRVTSDLSWTARLGTFFPGSAFSDQTTRTFFLVGATYSF
jgi:hypothetical protein